MFSTPSARGMLLRWGGEVWGLSHRTIRTFPNIHTLCISQVTLCSRHCETVHGFWMLTRKLALTDATCPPPCPCPTLVGTSRKCISCRSQRWREALPLPGCDQIRTVP